MIVTHHGKQFFKLQLGDTTIAVNPIGKDSKAKASRFGADVALVTTRHHDFDGVENVTYGDKVPFVIDGPGSYEILGNYVQGLYSETKIGKDSLVNTLYYFTFDNIKILFVGALSSKELPTQTLEAIEDVDIVFIPVGSDLLMPAEAHKLAVSFSPHVIIPMSDDQAALKQFLKEGGDEKIKPEQKFTVKSKDLADKKADIVVITS